ncbi:MAG: BrnT family toxin [Chloroflexi bacterium]|nr:BrnT family toxin [Chloroflexota bacterium]
MDIQQLTWDDWNEAHIASHGVRRGEVEGVSYSNDSLGVRIRRRRYRLIGQTEAGRYLMVILDSSGRGRFYVVTARDATEAERLRLRRWRGR